MPHDVLNLLESRKISAGHAKILVGLDNASFVATKINEKNLSVRQAESLVKIYKKKKGSIKTRDVNVQSLENEIIEKIGLKVLINNKKDNKGSIKIEYKNLDQLNRIIKAIKSHY